MRAQRWRLVPAAAAARSVAAGCTDGITPDCSDAQCAVVSVVEAGVDGGDGGDGGQGGADAGGAEADAPETIDAKPGEMSDVTADAPPVLGDAGNDAARDASAD